MSEESSRTVVRVLALLDQLSVSPRALSNLELATALAVPLSSMHRMLRKLHLLGYVDCDPDTACYSAAPRLSELGGRLAEVGGYSAPLQALMSALREQTGNTISVWVPSGAHVRISALLVGKVRGPTSNVPGELVEPFSTPGLAIASQYSAAQIRRLLALARRRRIPLGRKFQRSSEISKTLDQVIQRGYAVGFNMRSDGWGMLAWPIPLTLAPLRHGALAIGAQVPELRRQQNDLVVLAERLRAVYLKELAATKGAFSGRDSRQTSPEAAT